MCLNPITITREYRSLGIKRCFTVPCGKCAECLSKKRSEIAALSVLEANVSGSLYFFTLTYRNDELPVAISDNVDGIRRVVGFERGYKFKASPDAFKNSVSFASPNWLDDEGHNLGSATCYSLCREDVKLWLKQCRRDWSRLHKDDPLKFSYLICGEYGEMRGRPHYHGLFYGLTAEQASFFAEHWEKRFGFVLVEPTPGSSSPAGALADAPKVCNYVSKYMFKGVYSAWEHILPYVEKPRRQSSIRFGLTDDETMAKLSDFIKAAILSSLTAGKEFECRLLVTSLVSLIDKKVSLYKAVFSRFLVV